MKTTRTVSALALSLLAAAQAGAQTSAAFDTKSGVVSAQVLDTCKFKNPTSTFNLVLSNLDPSSNNGKSSTEQYNFFCTNGFSVQIGVAGQTALLNAPGGHNRQLTHKTDPAQTLAYNLTSSLPDGNTGKGFGPGKDLALYLTATVEPRDYQDAKGGEYEDTVVVEPRPRQHIATPGPCAA